tara:strand:+ start:299 stop:538 length:240 start_codon:yes stop_codon:yes gene_type:complete
MNNLNAKTAAYFSELIENYATLEAAVQANGENCSPSLKRERTISKNLAESKEIPNFEERFANMLEVIKSTYVGVTFKTY